MKVRTFLIGILTLLAMPLGAGERLAMSVSPAVSFAPAHLVVRAMIEADEFQALVSESTLFKYVILL